MRAAASELVQRRPASFDGVARIRGLAVALVAAVVGCGGPEAPTPAPPPAVAVIEDAEATTLAVAVVAPGSAWELPGTEGLTILSAMTLLETMGPALEGLGARARVVCTPATFTFTLVAPRDAGAPALNTFLDGLFRPAPTEAALDRARSRLRASLAMDQASPAWQARLAVRRALHNDTLSSGWLGPACGVPETLALFDTADIRAGAHRFAPRLAVAAAIAPSADGDAVRAQLEDRIRAGRRPIPAPRTVTASGRYVERNTVTARLGVAFPFDRDADIEAIRLLGAVLEDAIAPGVDRPESFTAEYEIERHGSGGALVLRAVTAPTRAADYADRVEALVARVASTGVAAPVFERVARRHRGERLLGLEAPEARAAELAGALAYGTVPRQWPEPRIPSDRVRDAAAGLGAPARSVVGPRSARGAVEP